MVALNVISFLPQYAYDVAHLIDLFYRKHQWRFIEAHQKTDEVPLLFLKADGQVTLISDQGETLTSQCIDLQSIDAKLELKRAIYNALSQLTEASSKWGILVGIRPVKIVHELLDQGYNNESIRNRLQDLYLIEPDKIELLMSIAMRERPHLYPIDEQAVSLYVSIPFCPTRCVYCSFPSNAMAQKGKLVEAYVEALVKEIRVALNHIESSGRFVDCVYIGGGTPSILSADQFERLFVALSSKIDLKAIKEFTVEAGRPDVITEDQLRVFKTFGVNRVCVNPQTMNDDTLKRIGRNHTADKIAEAMALVKGYDFPVVNMDLILGLPGEGLSDVQNTVERVLALAPENITLHTLAVKRASDLNHMTDEIELAHDAEVSAMMAYADERLKQSGLMPYYMYRQKKMIGHLENVGYAIEGASSLYNMRIIEERHTIVALGAGAVSKLCFPRENRHERIANFKGVEEYLNRFDEILKKKKLILDKGRL